MNVGRLVEKYLAFAPNAISLIPGMSWGADRFLLKSATLPPAAAGAMEFSGGAAYFSPEASNRALLLGAHVIRQDSDYTGTNVNTAQKLFDESTNGLITLTASTKYFLRAVFHVHTTGTDSHDFRILFSNSAATFTAFNYSYFATLVATEVSVGPALGWFAAATENTLTAAAASATHHTVILDGVVEVNGAGTFIPQYRWSAAPGVAGVTLRGSYLMLIPAGTVTVGAWS
jgi:hypothetical protein